MYIRTMWADYFTGSPTLIQSKKYGTSQTLSGTDVHVLNCLFRSITSESNGGALSCSTSLTNLLIETTSFFSCKTSGYGGAIYFVNKGSGQCVLYKICGYDCCTTSSSHGQFTCIEMNNADSSKNYVNYSSISRCVNENSSSYHTLRHLYGQIHCPLVNITMNKCYYRSGIYCVPFSDSNSVTCSLSYSTFANNNATYSICILLESSNSKYEIKSCNILRNTQGSPNSEGTIYTWGNLIIEDSCILENNANYIFYVTSSSYSITLSNCTVDKTSNNRNLIIQNTVTKSFILALNHMSTRNCHSEYDSVGTLTPITQPLSPSKKQKLYYSCERFFHQPRLIDILSLTSVFIFTFVCPYTSSHLLC
jgi:hypothetical protein